MKLLFLSNIYPSRVHPEKGRFNAVMIESLRKQHKVHVVCPVSWLERLKWSTRRWLEQKQESDFGPGADSAEWPLSFYTPRIMRAQHGNFLWWSIRHRLRDFVARSRPEAILAYWAHPDGDAAVRLGREFHIPVVCMVGGSDILLLSKDDARRRKIEWVLHNSDRVVAVSRHLAERVRDLGVNAKRIDVLYRGIDRRVFCPGDRLIARRKLGLRDAGLVLLHVGRFVPVKNHRLLISACRLLRDEGLEFRCFLVGDGPMKETLQAEIRNSDLEDRVKIVGSLVAEQLADWYRAADLTVLSSDSEGVPNVVLESIGCETPVVATDVGGVSEVLDLGLDGLVPAGNSQELACAIRERWENPGIEIGRRFIPEDLDESANRLSAILRRACSTYRHERRVENSVAEERDSMQPRS